uniref:Uncharacterized protein LOC114327731 n=1 Tax=Diabrotica virgifera virgifera TaxID=50390 RepID=A0A6P7FG68_DIAVI
MILKKNTPTAYYVTSRVMTRITCNGYACCLCYADARLTTKPSATVVPHITKPRFFLPIGTPYPRALLRKRREEAASASTEKSINTATQTYLPVETPSSVTTGTTESGPIIEVKEIFYPSWIFNRHQWKHLQRLW